MHRVGMHGDMRQVVLPQNTNNLLKLGAISKAYPDFHR
jgi:hypothetical protein